VHSQENAYTNTVVDSLTTIPTAVSAHHSTKCLLQQVRPAHLRLHCGNAAGASCTVEQLFSDPRRPQSDGVVTAQAHTVIRYVPNVLVTTCTYKKAVAALHHPLTQACPLPQTVAPQWAPACPGTALASPRTKRPCSCHIRNGCTWLPTDVKLN
jgi:hypothetical protein